MNNLRKKTPAEGVMRLALQAALRRDYSQALAQVAGGGILRPEDLSALRHELPAFEVAVWHISFIAHANAQPVTLDTHELGRRFGVALSLAATDIRKDRGQALAEAEHLIELHAVYLEACGNAHSDRSTMDGCALAMVQALTGRVLPDLPLSAAPESDRRLQVVTIGRDAYHMIEAAFGELSRQWQLDYS